MEPQNFREALTFDDVLLVPRESAVLPSAVDTTTKITPKISLKVPILSAAMDTVTEASSAIAMAQSGGVGILHKNMSIEEQAAQVARVKKYESGMVAHPIAVRSTDPISLALKLQDEHNISGFPVTDGNGLLVGILTNRDIRAARGEELQISSVMTPLDKMVTASLEVTKEAAIDLLHKHRVEKLPLIDKQGRLAGLMTIKDAEQSQRYPFATKDSEGSLQVGAAVGVGPEAIDRAVALIEAGADFVCVDTAHGHTKGVLDTLNAIRNLHQDAELVAGNISTADGALALADAGACAVKIGQGPGSICTTRIVSGCGMPQLTAIIECARVLANRGVYLISDGGIKFSGDIVKALAAGAHAVMIGSLLAGTEEAPGEVILYQGRRYKVYRGMGSLSAMAEGSRDRYGQADVADLGKLVPEGIEGRVPYRGPISDTLFQLVGGLRSGMGYVGAQNLTELHKRAEFVRVSSAGLRESHVHDVKITKEAPNYSVE